MTVSRALPVELISFSADWTAAGNRLRWSTASEHDNAYFAIESSLTGKVFETIGQKAAQGTTSQHTDYQYIDSGKNRQEPGLVVYYRLRQVDNSGTVAYSQVQIVNVPSSSSKASLAVSGYPNPYSQQLQMSIQTPVAGPATLQIQDALGRILRTQTANLNLGSNEVEIKDASALQSGVYFITLSQGSLRKVVSVKRD